MVQLGPELVPEGVTLAEALPWLGALAGLLFARGLLTMLDAFVRALFGTVEGAVGWIPFAGKVVKRPIAKIEQKLSNILGAAVNKIDAYIAHSWHQLSILVRQIGREIEGLAHDLWAISWAYKLLWPPYLILKAVKLLIHPLRTVQRAEQAILRRLRSLVLTTKAIAVDVVLPRVGVLERDVAQVIEHDIATLRARTRTLERRALREFKWLRTRPWLIASAAMTATVALCLRRLGLGWLRCRNVGRVGKRLCGLPTGLIDDLLGLALAFGVLVDPEEVAKLAVGAEDLVEPLFHKMLD